MPLSSWPQCVRLFGRPGSMFCWTHLIRYLLNNPELVVLPKPEVPDAPARPSEMLRTLRSTYNGPSFQQYLAHTQSMPSLHTKGAA